MGVYYDIGSHCSGTCVSKCYREGPGVKNTLLLPEEASCAAEMDRVDIRKGEEGGKAASGLRLMDEEEEERKGLPLFENWAIGLCTSSPSRPQSRREEGLLK